MENDFVLVGSDENEAPLKVLKKRKEKFPLLAAGLLGVIVLGCIFAELIMKHDPSYMDLSYCKCPPSSRFLFGTDTMGRDIFSMIWYGGRISLFIGFIATIISTGIAVLYGSFAGMSVSWVSEIMMRFLDIILSVPGILLVIFMQAVIGANNIISLSVVIGLTSFMSMAKLIRVEVKKLSVSEYVIASKHMGGNFFHILRLHLLPNFLPTIMFMVVMSVRNAIVMESTLSFLGIGLPIKIISWGSMLSLSEKALMTNAWWIILIPGTFLIITLLCLTSIGNYLRKENNKKESYL